MRAGLGLAMPHAVPTAFAFDTVTGSGAITTSPKTFTHTPLGTPVGALLLMVVYNDTSTIRVQSVTYGAASMTQITGSPFAAGMGAENDSVLWGWFVGSGVPAGAQTVTITLSATIVGRAALYTVVGPSDTAIESTITKDQTTGATNPTATITIANSSQVCGMCVSSEDAVGSLTVGSGYTSVGAGEIDIGNETVLFGYRTALTATNATIDFTDANSITYSILGAAIKTA